MILIYSATSPYVRKVMLVAHELNILDKLELQPHAVSPIEDNPTVAASNPLTKVPTLITEDEGALFDSPVICEFLDAKFGGNKLLPAAGSARWQALRRQALADGLLDGALLVRYENAMRPEALRWAEWSDGQQGKINRALAALESEADTLPSGLDLGTITIAAALGYLDFRFAHDDWRANHPKLAGWFKSIEALPSYEKTQPPRG